MTRHVSVDGSVSIEAPGDWVNQKDTRLVEAHVGLEGELADLARRNMANQIGPFGYAVPGLPYGRQVSCQFRNVPSGSPPPLERLMREAYSSAKAAAEDGAPIESVFVEHSREFVTESGLLGGATSVDHTWGRGAHSEVWILVLLTPTREAVMASLAADPFPRREFDELVRVAQTIQVHSR